jgi:hypothetical protein
MESVIGLGDAGCRVADAFSAYPQYSIYKIDADLPDTEGENLFSLNVGLTHREYEDSVPDMSEFLSCIEGDDVLFVMGGSGFVSGAALRILQQLHDLRKKINVLYIKPDTELLSGDKFLQERLVYRVLQEYARSGVFERLYLVHNPTIEKLVGEVPLKEYYKKLNEVITSTFHMVTVFNHSTPEHESSVDALNSSRISTIGVMSIEKNEESFFFPLDNVTDRCYYYAINKTSLEEDGKLFGSIKEQVRERSMENNRVSYKVYSTKYAENLCYCVAHSNQIQVFPEKVEKELDKA